MARAPHSDGLPGAVAAASAGVFSSNPWSYGSRFSSVEPGVDIAQECIVLKESTVQNSWKMCGSAAASAGPSRETKLEAGSKFRNDFRLLWPHEGPLGRDSMIVVERREARAPKPVPLANVGKGELSCIRK